MLRRVMVVVLLGCVGLTAGVAFGTLFSGNRINPSMVSIVLPDQGSCNQHWYFIWTSDKAAGPQGPHHPVMRRLAQPGRCLLKSPAIITYSAPPGRLPMGSYVLFGLLAGLSAAVGFLVPPRSRMAAAH
ncbi:MAG TPA: hypothetical protein VF506_19265 [Streptosporangiaceae bacterium]